MLNTKHKRSSGRDGATVEELIATNVILGGWVLLLISEGANPWVIAFFVVAGLLVDLAATGAITTVQRHDNVLVLRRANRLRPVRVTLQPGQSVTFEPAAEIGSHSRRCGGTAVYVDDRLVTVIDAGRDGYLVRGRAVDAPDLVAA